MKKIHFNQKSLSVLLLMAAIFGLSLTARAQNGKTKFPAIEHVPDTNKIGFPVMPNATDTGKNGGIYLNLRQCIDYALTHQPALNKSLINVDITRQTNAVNLAGWLPQVNASGNLVHYIQQSNTNISTTTSGTTGAGTSTGSSSTLRSSYANTFVPELAVSQAIVSPELLYNSRSAPLLVKQAQQVTDSTKIYVVAAVSKAFYNVLLTLQQINVLKEDTARLGRNLRDTYHQYKSGIVDETDYLQATITLNNSKTQLKQANENVIPQYAALKQLMGYEPEKQFNVTIDTVQMMNDIRIDTTKQLQYEKRVEYQQIITRRDLQFELTHYYKYAYIPTVSGFFNYNLQFANNNFPSLLSNSYPSSLIGLSLNIPIFTGFARVHNLRKSRLQEQEIHWDEVDLRSQLYKEYASGLAGYKSNLYNFNMQQKNVAMARRVYFVVNLQYKQGIVAYLNVITAESNLITSEINYTNALFQLLSSKIDLEKAMGDITY
ncbi:TolC family protein [Mucilaginibacter paludis]|uniref:Outer membrane efflux protein n=1 Tax=Mucilaginibacter paludis DSM 18603 TaxID=714943 RepID=H1YAL1_9SPHI|nr:TolC family protein [Mucilaginibacter paludis]EHQ29131.1 outer membrane efflux protein [Mucilaginibacter paludis DSM 18603]